ncbi:hypothetical protein [Pseudohoeflea coraliihabitans]|nr:hypothetical protein [Pseudohoeflea sp. DP4N28-3]
MATIDDRAIVLGRRAEKKSNIVVVPRIDGVLRPVGERDVAMSV